MQNFHLAVTGAQRIYGKEGVALDHLVKLGNRGGIGSNRGSFLGYLIDGHHHIDRPATVTTDAGLGGFFASFFARRRLCSRLGSSLFGRCLSGFLFCRLNLVVLGHQCPPRYASTTR